MRETFIRYIRGWHYHGLSCWSLFLTPASMISQVEEHQGEQSSLNFPPWKIWNIFSDQGSGCIKNSISSGFWSPERLQASYLWLGLLGANTHTRWGTVRLSRAWWTNSQGFPSPGLSFVKKSCAKFFKSEGDGEVFRLFGGSPVHFCCSSSSVPLQRFRLLNTVESLWWWLHGWMSRGNKGGNRKRGWPTGGILAREFPSAWCDNSREVKKAALRSLISLPSSRCL